MALYLKLLYKENDFDLLAEWHKEHVKINFSDSLYKKEEFLNLIRNDFDKENVFMRWVFDEKEKIGFIWLKKIYDIYKELFYCDLHYIQIDSKKRGQGYGDKLMKIIEDWAKENDCREIRLGTSADNEIAINLYKKHGFIIKRISMEKKLCQVMKK